MKKFLCLFLALITAFSVMTVNVGAAETVDNNMNIYGIYLSREGDCTLLESGGEWLLIDTGLADVSEEFLAKLEKYEIEELDVLISHMHTDHMGGFEALASSNIKINSLYLPHPDLTPDDPYCSGKYTIIEKQLAANNPQAITQYLKKGESFSFGSVAATVLGPVANVAPDDFTESESQSAVDHYVNCRSLTVKFVCGDISYLTAGDIEKEEELALVKEYKATGELNADILKLSHHALPTSNTAEFLEAVSPRFSFALNSNKGYAEGSNYRLYYNSYKNASKYGPVYLVGDEKVDFAAKVADGRIELYKGDEKLSGLVTLAGGDGTVVKTDKYYITDSDVEEGVYTIDGKKYYIFDGGYVNKAYYSFNLERYIYRYEPIENGNVRYFDEDGVMYTGFRKIGDYTYYFDTETGILLKGDQDYKPVFIGSKIYAINENGIIFNYASDSGAWKKYGSQYRYFDENGVMQTGWLKLGTSTYYLDTYTGFRTTGLKKISKKCYYFSDSGVMYNSGWKKFGSNYRYFNSKGIMQTGWLKVGSKIYYLNTSTGYRTIGLKKVSGKYYCFNESGVMYKSSWVKFGSKKRYFDKNGVMLTGTKKINGKTYKFDKNGYLKK